VVARELSITLLAVRKTISRGSASGDEGLRDNALFDFEIPLDGEKEHEKGMVEYPFEIEVPADVESLKPNIPEVEGKVGTGLKLIQSAASIAGVGTQVRWLLWAKLDIPKGRDIKDKQDIFIK